MHRDLGMIAVDWGSSHFRAYRLDGDGGLLDALFSGKGVLSCPQGTNFEQVLRNSCAAWLAQEPDAPILMAGMVGSRYGWMETEYAPCPVNLQTLGSRILRIPGTRSNPLYLVPGVSAISPSNLPDVMRGEETQLFGAIDHAKGNKLIACLPGTHSKWVQMERGRITGFSTFMTGELFSTTSRCESLTSILHGSECGQIDVEAFLDGVRVSKGLGGLLHSLFSIRSRTLVQDKAFTPSPSYLSGLMVGAEVKAGLELYPGLRKIVVIGADDLNQSYRLAFSEYGVGTDAVSGQQALISGARRLATMANILPPSEGTASP